MSNPNIQQLGRQKPSELTRAKIKLGSMKAGVIKTEAFYQSKLEEKRKAIEEQEKLVNTLLEKENAK